jgi:hypothetical protein
MKYITALVIIFTSYFSVAQNTLYFMDRLPQNINYNPAMVPQMDFFIGLPGIGGVAAEIYNSGFTYNELDFFLDNLNNPDYVPDDFVKSMGDYNLLTAESTVNLASFGFKIREKSYLSFSINANQLAFNKASSDIAYILADLDDLNPDDFPIVVDNFSANGVGFFNFGVTYSRKINENLTLGITPRINFNMFGINTKDLYFRVDYNDIDLHPEKDEYEESYSGEIDLALPVPINPDAVENGELVGDVGILPEDWIEEITLGRILKDKSFMMDFGATYELDKWTFSASLLNVGLSKFKKDAYLLTGIEDKVLVDKAEKIKIGVPAKLFIGAKRQFSPKWNYALLFSNFFYSAGMVPAATASLNGYVGSALSASVSYTAGYKYNNLGLGLRLRFLPGTDLFFVTDNIIQVFNYKNAYRLTAAAGINIAIGANKRETTEIDVPVEIY